MIATYYPLLPAFVALYLTEAHDLGLGDVMVRMHYSVSCAPSYSV